MERDEKTQKDASGLVAARLVAALRKALGMTQQAFASHIKTAVTTVARWETNNPPPRGEALLKLAAVAQDTGHSAAIAEELLKLYLDDVAPRLPMMGIDVRLDDGSGYVVCRFNNSREAADVVKLLRRYASRLERELAELKEEKKR